MPLVWLLFGATVTVAALVIASLALVHTLPAWGVLFFYVLPTFFFALWGARELAPSLWRRATTRSRRLWRLSPLAGPPRPREETLPVAAPVVPAERAARGWLLLLRGPLRTLRSRRARRLLELAVVLVAVGAVALGVREVASRGWPLPSADPAWTAAACSFFLATFALRAVGWQRLFRPFERPRSLALVASNGIAAVAALALPSRLDDAVAVAAVRRLARRSPSTGTVALSLFLLGLVDVAALVPFAAFAAVASGASTAVRIALGAVAGVGVGAAVFAALLPSLRSSERALRFRAGRWLALHAPASRRDAAWAWLLVAASWLTRAAGLFMLLRAVDLGFSFAVAAAYVAGAAAVTTLPVGPAGAATQAGIGAAILGSAGADAGTAAAFAVAAQALTVVAAAALALFGVGLTRRGRRRARA